jgi:hypothetical protein
VLVSEPQEELKGPSNQTVNVGVIGTLGYFAYTRQNQPWDRRIVGSAVAGTLALFGAEG